MTDSSQNKSVVVLQNHGVIAHQTDTVVGLACLPTENLISRLCRIKQRHQHKSFILLASSLDQLDDYIQVDENILKTLDTTTQLPTTWLIPPQKNVSKQLIGSTNKIAVRISKHKGVKSICDHVGAIISTSANISDQPICRNTQQVREIFGPNIDYIDQNQTPGTGNSSTIIDLISGKILRG